MAIRIFYVTQGSLCVCLHGKGGEQSLTEFADDDQGLREFDAYIATSFDLPSAILIDVIEEEFSLDSIPKLGMRDRNALIRRRCERKFRRTPYRTSMLQGKSPRNPDEFTVVHSAISNHELVDPWLQVLLRYEVPLSGVYSVPLMVPRLHRRLFPAAANAMFVAPHQANKLRQVFLANGQLRSARLSQSPGVDSDDYAQFVVNEALRSRRYLERNRMLGSMDPLNVCVIADSAVAERITASVSSDDVNQFEFLDPDTAARKLGHRALRTADRFEEVFLTVASRIRPKQNYAASGENRYWVMQKVRSSIVGAVVATAATCSIAAALMLSDVWSMRNNITEIQSQVEFLSATFRQENEKFDPIKADSHEMQLAVDTGDYILSNRVPVPWIMNQLGAVLGDYPDVRIQELRWAVDAPVDENPRQQRRGDAPQPVPVPALTAVSAVLTADIEPFDGNMRRAFARIDELASDLRTRTHFDRAIAVEYPFDASTSAAVSGEIAGESRENAARFRLRVSYDLETDNSGETDESI
ncbi:MAG: hypothetical protein K0U72_14350 [Gammaproteobacteria bacterium]|nr:hypothetical protein [Gammaproteobacteria bacterium]